MQPLFSVLLLGATFSSAAFAGGPQTVAKVAPDLWPRPLGSVEAFDEASRAEIATFAAVYKRLAPRSVKPEDIGIKSLDATSVKRWSDRVEDLVVQAFASARSTCGAGRMLCDGATNSFADLAALAETWRLGLPKDLAAWSAESEPFYGIYIKEQLRLAALFPKPTSEILTLASNETQGDAFADREFLITLDDGPTPIGGDTERYVKLLNESGVAASFFVLGDALETRRDKAGVPALRDLYKGQCVASHGFKHDSHQKLATWADSLDRTAKDIRELFPETKVVHFRPPYGQRHAGLAKALAESGGSVVLWNIDSQDWHGKIDAAGVEGRVKKLMLLWRHGIILFHDVHHKALAALPHLLTFAKANGATWRDCGKVP